MRRASGQRGNIFAMLFASVALVGVLGASAMNVLGGPVSTVQRVTQKNLAQTHMMLSARVLLNVATDFDGDGMSEAPAYRSAGALPAPVGGGLLPDTLGLALTDPWGNAYGYCVYDHGTDNASPDRLTGDNTGGASVQTMVALVASGPNKAFETTCAAYSGGPVSVASAVGSDDLILHYSYTEAAASSAGLWTLNASDQNKAELKDNGGAVAVSVNRSGGILEAVAVSASTISAPASAADTLGVGGGLLLDGATGAATVCGAGQFGALRLAASKTGLEICDGAGAWPALRAVPIAAGSDDQLQVNDGGQVVGASSLFWNSTNSQFVMGSVPWAASTTYLAQVSGTGGNAGLSIDRYSASAAGHPKLVFRRARGTPTAPEAVQTGDNLGIIAFSGYVAGNYQNDGSGASVFLQAQTTGTAADALNMGARLRVFVMPDGAATATERLSILSTGFTGLSVATPRSMLHVAGAVQVGDDAAACVALKYGAIRFASGLLQVCNASGWQTVTTSATVTWGRINGAGVSIEAGGNLASVAKNATGDWTISYSVALPSNAYAATVTPQTTSPSGFTCQAHTLSASSLRVRCFNLGGAADVNFSFQIVGP